MIPEAPASPMPRRMAAVKLRPFRPWWVDPSAGDCSIGVLAAALAGGLPLEDAIRRGNAAAGHLVSLGDEERDARFAAAGPRRGV